MRQFSEVSIWAEQCLSNVVAMTTHYLRFSQFSDIYYPNEFLRNDEIDDDEKYFEVTSIKERIIQRILWLAHRISTHKKWLTYDTTE